MQGRRGWMAGKKSHRIKWRMENYLQIALYSKPEKLELSRFPFSSFWFRSLELCIARFSPNGVVRECWWRRPFSGRVNIWCHIELQTESLTFSLNDGRSVVGLLVELIWSDLQPQMRAIANWTVWKLLCTVIQHLFEVMLFNRAATWSLGIP